MRILSILMLLSVGTAIGATHAKKKYSAHQIYIALRTDGVAGFGTKKDPFDGSDPAKLFAILRGSPANTHLNFAAGTFQINAADILPVEGVIKSGWKVHGAGKRLTTIRLIGSVPELHSVWVLASPGGVFTSNVKVSDLTVDCNWPDLAATATTGKTDRTFDGATAKERSTITGNGFSPTDVGEVISGPDIPPNIWIGAIVDATHATLSSSATSNTPASATATGNGTFTIASKQGAVHGIGIGGSNNRLERVRVINTYGSHANDNECFALGLGGTDYSGVQKRGNNNWIVDCDAELPWGTYSSPFAASNVSNSGVIACRAVGINDGFDGRGWSTGGVNGAAVKNFAVRNCRFADTYGVFYIDTGTLDGLDVANNATVRGKMGCAIVNAASKKNIRITHNCFNLQNRSASFPTTAIQFLRAPPASNVEIRGNSITFDHSGIGVDLFRALQAGPISLDATARVEDNVGPQSQASKGDPHGVYRNNRDINGVDWFRTN